MRFGLALGFIGGLVVAATLPFTSGSNAADTAGMLLSHDVFFTLKENTPGNKQKLVDACHKYLKGHPGEAFYSAGVLCEDLKREVNDLAFDVALHIVFKDRASHDKYQDAPRHLEFIDKNKALWKSVRVFDSNVSK